MGGALDGLLELAGSIDLGQTAADGAGLLWAEVKWHVLLVLVEQAELGALVGVDDGQDLGDGLADVVAVDGLVMPCHLQAPNSGHRTTQASFGRAAQLWSQRAMWAYRFGGIDNGRGV